MEKIERTEAPEWLEEKWEEWGKEWDEKYKKNKKSSFEWRRYKKKGYEDLLEKLSEMTQHHCSFCDSYPMRGRMKPTIEHFRPKTKFPHVAYKWDNLFLCCYLCQEKGDKFDDRLLKPDDYYYSFDKYFDINWETGELEANEDASEEDKERAKITIKLYRLNCNGKPDDRLEELGKFEESNAFNIDKSSYRFFIKRGSDSRSGH